MAEKTKAGIYFPEPLGLSDAEIMKRAEKFRKETGFKCGETMEEFIPRIGGKVEHGELGRNSKWTGMTHIRNFEKFDNAPLPQEPKIKFYVNMVKEEYTYLKNYITAQLLGHYVLHCPKGKKIYGHYDIVEAWYDPFEFPEVVYREAGFFALYFLMPERPFKKKWEELLMKKETTFIKNEMEDFFGAPGFVLDVAFKNFRIGPHQKI